MDTDSIRVGHRPDLGILLLGACGLGTFASLALFLQALVGLVVWVVSYPSGIDGEELARYVADAHYEVTATWPTSDGFTMLAEVRGGKAHCQVVGDRIVTCTWIKGPGGR